MFSLHDKLAKFQHLEIADCDLKSEAAVAKRRKVEASEVVAPLPDRMAKLLMVRGMYVALDFEVANFFGVPTRRLNEQVSRNVDKFGDDFAFRLTPDEVDDLRSQNAISSSEWGGSRYPPRAFTEHGVVMAATLLRSPRAIHATRLVVKAFVELRQQVARSDGKHPSQYSLPLPFRDELMSKISGAITHVLDALVNPDEVKKAREEARGVLADGIRSIKELLSKPGLDNEKRIAEVRKLMAEAESIEVETDGKRLLNEEKQLALLAKKLSLVMQAQHFVNTGRMDDFVQLLNELSMPTPKLLGSK